jgi:4-diphosphocytidyl-2-C-methyl-D-erythritol kinase
MVSRRTPCSLGADSQPDQIAPPNQVAQLNQVTQPNQITLSAPAKLNLRLTVLAREESGYHSIETIFHKLALADDVTVRLQPPGTALVECSADVGPGEHNLAFKAARAFCSAARWDTGFHIQITKQIPVRGGLGGGSADAAAVLRGLNALAPAPLAPHELLRIASGIGADVPFLTSDAVMALGWGRGERLLSLDALPARDVVLIVPPFGINTAEAYQWVDELHGTVAPTPIALRLWQLTNWDELAPLATNDLTPAAVARHPELATYISGLQRAGATLAGMTGSGSVVFGIFASPLAADQLPEFDGCQVLHTRTA